LSADEDWQDLAELFPGKKAFVYGSLDSALVYTYDSAKQLLEIEFGVSDGQVVGGAR
jgi:hypothetical protein